MTVTSVAILGFTADGVLGDAMISVSRDGRCSSTIRSPVAGGGYLGQINECELHRGDPAVLFDQIETALAGVHLASWAAQPPLPRHLRGATTLVISDDHEGSWIAADAAGVQALQPWVAELERRMRRDPAAP